MHTRKVFETLQKAVGIIRSERRRFHGMEEDLSNLHHKIAGLEEELEAVRNHNSDGAGPSDTVVLEGPFAEWPPEIS